MYTIKYNDTILHNPVMGYVLRNPSFHLAVNEAGSGSFIIDTDHPGLSDLKRMSGIVELQSDSTPIFRGRILRDTADFYKSRTIEIEGVMACLNDSVIPPFEYPDDVSGADTAENTVEYFLSWLLSQHNAQVTEEQQIKLGTVTVTDPNNYISRSSESYLSTMEAVKGKLLDLLGGYFVMRYESDGNYLDYYTEFPLTNTQQVTFADNLLDLTHEKDGSDIYTAILPVGKDGLTIEDELDGKITSDLIKSGNIIYSVSGRETYGNITRIVEWSDVTLSKNLKTKAAKQLALGFGTTDTLTISAIDLGLTSDDVQDFRVGRNVIVYSYPHSISATLPLMELDVDVTYPENTQITLGASSLTFTDSSVLDQQDNARQIQLQEIEHKELKKNIETITEETTKQITSAVQDSQSIIFQALTEYTRTNDFSAYQQTVSSQFEQLSNSITLSIQTVTNEIARVDNDAQQKISDITKYFRFDSDGLWIGETGNEVLLNLDNDIIQFLKNNFAELWLDPDGVHADNLETNRIQIGNFEFVSEADGRLSITRVVNDD